MNDGDEGNAITFDTDTGLVYFTKKSGMMRALHVSSCDWLELDDIPPLPVPPKK